MILTVAEEGVPSMRFQREYVKGVGSFDYEAASRCEAASPLRMTP
jgi:hypothetical protein